MENREEKKIINSYRSHLAKPWSAATKQLLSCQKPKIAWGEKEKGWKRHTLCLQLGNRQLQLQKQKEQNCQKQGIDLWYLWNERSQKWASQKELARKLHQSVLFFFPSSNQNHNSCPMQEKGIAFLTLEGQAGLTWQYNAHIQEELPHPHCCRSALDKRALLQKPVYKFWSNTTPPENKQNITS